VARADHFTIVAAGIKVALDLSVGHAASFEVTREGRTTAPFHRAPWADEPEVAGTEGAPHLARLSGDFFCAPFGATDVEPAPAHGWPANARWEPLGVTAVRDGVTARFALERPVMRARVLKELTLRDGHPFLYQRHIFEGGAGAIPEDGCTWSLNGHAASTAENPLSREGIPTAIRCGGDRPAEVRHVIGAVPVGDGFGPVDAIDTEPGRLIVRGKEGAVVLPFDTEFLSEES
jgi:hypothetical protein